MMQAMISIPEGQSGLTTVDLKKTKQILAFSVPIAPQLLKRCIEVRCFNLVLDSFVTCKAWTVTRVSSLSKLWVQPAVQPRILFGSGQSMTSSVTDIFLTVENWYKAPVKILANLFRGGHGPFGPVLAAPLMQRNWFDRILPMMFYSKLQKFVSASNWQL